MSIATEKKNNASERFMLVRLNPRRAYDFAADVSDVYEATFNVAISGVTIDGESLTRVTGTPDYDEYRHNEDTGVLTIKYESAVSFTAIVSYYLFYTGTVHRIATEDPENSATSLRQWDAKILSYPKLSEGFTDILSGVFSIQDTSLELINDDLGFSDYLTDDDSFNNAEVIFWSCINSLENIKRVFTGKVASISLDKFNVYIKCQNAFKALDQTASMDRLEEDYEVTGLTPLVSPKDVGRFVPFVFGKDTYFKTLEVEYTPGDSYNLITDANRAICASYGAVSTSGNRTWVLCHATGDVQNQAYGTCTNVNGIIVGGNYVSQWSSYTTQIGDTFKVQYNNGGVKTDYFIVIRTTTTIPGGNLTLAMPTPNIGAFTPGNIITVYNLPSIAVVISDGVNYWYPYYERDYTLSTLTYPYGVTGATTKVHGIDFVTNFEANFPTMGTLDPNKHTVYYRVTLPSMSHGTALKEMVIRSGLTDDGNFDTGANAALVAPVQFQIPNIDETQPNNYLKYCQDILKGTVGYLRVDESGDVEYLLAGTPSATETRDGNLILHKSLNMDVEYQDVATHISTYNPHNQNKEETSSVTLNPALSASNTRAQYLHAVRNVNRFKHPFKYIDNLIDRLIGIYSSRRVSYSFKTATEDIDTKLGDDLLLDSGIVAGSGTVKVTEIVKTSANITIRATDLLGI